MYWANWFDCGWRDKRRRGRSGRCWHFDQAKLDEVIALRDANGGTLPRGTCCPPRSFWHGAVS
jgi:hypothetical protein